MTAASALFAIAAVLAEDRVVFVDTGAGSVLREVRLPLAAAAVFAAPDGRVLLPAVASDETIVISQKGTAERWPGRLFPVFFDEIDRMHTVLPALLLTLSYPERLPVLRVDVPGVATPWRAACSSNGNLVAICARPEDRLLVLAIAEPGAMQREYTLAAPPRAVVVAPEGDWVAVGLASSAVQVVFTREDHIRSPEAIGDEVRALALAADGRSLLVGAGSGGSGSVLAFKVDKKSAGGLKPHHSLPLAAPVDSIAAGGGAVVAVAGGQVVVLDKRCRELVHKVPIGNARQVVLLPGEPASALPPWSESP